VGADPDWDGVDCAGLDVGPAGPEDGGLAGFPCPDPDEDEDVRTACVTEEATEPVVAGEPPGVVSACAWREKMTSRTSIPAASIADCTARRAMCRKVARATSRPPIRETITWLYFFPNERYLHNL
jgi:hypothetical protein